MKNVWTVALSTFAGFASLAAEAHTAARSDALHAANAMVATLEDIQELASDLAERAERRGQHADAYALDNVADSADALEQKVLRQIVYPLYDGQTFAYVKAQLSRIQSAFSLLQRDADDVDYMPYDLSDLIDEVNYLKYELADILQAGDRGRSDRADGSDRTNVPADGAQTPRTR